MRKQIPFALIFALTFQSAGVHAQDSSQYAFRGEPGEHNPGPDPKTEMGKAYLDIQANLPEYKLLSEALNDRNKFRDIYGPMVNRVFSYEPNSVQVAFFGQDATHVAEFAKHTATAGFGGRAQDLARYFGVDKTAAFSNASFSTIYGQYGTPNHPVVTLTEDGKPKVELRSYIDSQLWALFNDSRSALRQSSNEYIEWMLKYNPESLRLFVLFGGMSRDMLAEFLISRGAQVGTRMAKEQVELMRIPVTRITNAGGNNEIAIPQTADGKDVYNELVNSEQELKDIFDKKMVDAVTALEKASHARGSRGMEAGAQVRKIQRSRQDLKKTGKVELDYSIEAHKEFVSHLVKIRSEKAADLMVYTEGGVGKSGAIHPGQLGGYDLNEIVINGKKTRNLKGLVLSDGTVVSQDILVTEMPHPTRLSMMTPDQAAKEVARSLERLEPYVKAGWTIKAEAGLKNRFAAGLPYEYARTDLRKGFYESGTPEVRMVSVSSASRMSGNPRVIISGTRDRVSFDQDLVERASNSKQSEPMDPRELATMKPRTPETRYLFDRGPGFDIRRIMDTSIDLKAVMQPKPGMSVKENGIDALNVKTSTGMFGEHRGSFVDSRVLILADPHGVDDLITSRALTGARGQYLNGLMRDLGVGEKYLVLKTVPFGMDGATAEEWEKVRSQTETYREKLIVEALKSGTIEYIFADGDVAQDEVARIAKKLKIRQPVIGINRGAIDSKTLAADPSSGIAEAGAEAKRVMGLGRGVKISGKMIDLPRTHLTAWQRYWEGRGGDHVLNANDKNRGFAFASIVPEEVVNQKLKPNARTQKSIEVLTEFYREQNIRLPGEKAGGFVGRGAGKSFAQIKPALEEAYRNVKVSARVDTAKVLRMTPRTAAPTTLGIRDSGGVQKACGGLF